jgi:hypothetical protein
VGSLRASLTIFVRRWRDGRRIREKGLLAEPGETSPGRVEQRVKNQLLRLTLFEGGRAAPSAGEPGGEVVSEPVEILAGGQLTPRRDNAWSSRERCDRVVSENSIALKTRALWSRVRETLCQR